MSDEIAVITGFSRGLGRSAALHLAARGVGVIGTYRANRDAADGVVREIEAAGAKAVALPLDVREAGGFPAFADGVAAALRDTWGRDRFDYLYNNAGTGVSAPIGEISESDVDAMLAEHVKAPLLLTQALLGLIADGGAILNESSGLARFANAGYSAYGAAKGGVETLTRYMAVELGPRRIRANTIVPGAIATDFAGGGVRDNEQANAAIASVTALGRVGEADDIGRAVAAILSDDFGWADGTRIELSGGQQL